MSDSPFSSGLQFIILENFIKCNGFYAKKYIDCFNVHIKNRFGFLK